MLCGVRQLSAKSQASGSPLPGPPPRVVSVDRPSDQPSHTEAHDMNLFAVPKRLVMAGVLTGSLLAGGVLGATILGPTLANAATTTPSPSSTSSGSTGTGSTGTAAPSMPAHGSAAH